MMTTSLNVDSKPEYHRLDSGAHESSRFFYLDKLILLVPLNVSITPSLEPRNQCLVRFVTVLFLVLNMVDLFYFGYMSINETDDPFNIFINAFNYGLWAISKCLSMYYFYFYFNYPWHSRTIHRFKSNPMRSDYKPCNIPLLMAVLTVSMIADSVSTYIPYESAKELYPYFKYIGPILFEYLSYYTPICIMFVIQYMIVFKYRGYAQQLITDVAEKTDTKIIACKYVDLYQQFSADYHIWLQRAIQSYIVAEVVYIWTISYSVLRIHKLWRVLELLWVISIFLLYLIPAFMLNYKFEELREVIQRYGFEAVHFDGDTNMGKYNYLSLCLTQHPLQIRVGSHEVSIWNTLKVAFVFLVGRLASYSVKDLYNDGAL